MAEAKKTKFKKPPPAPAAAPRWTPADAALLAGLALLAVFFLYISWRKWPDPIVDFGRELYLPWRLSRGDVLYRDLQHLYGPLSKYYHGMLFKTAGAAMTTLVASNLLIYSAILAMLYYLLRDGWGRLAAFVACAIFVAVFSFSHLVGIGNYTYAAPYAHEATHGLALTLLLVLVWRGAIERPQRRRFFFAGLLSGLGALLKPEFILAAAAVAAGGALLLTQKRAAPSLRRGTLYFAAGVVLPPLVAAALFWLLARVPFGDALQYANNAWITPLRITAAVTAPEQRYYSGFDHVSVNLLRELSWGAAAVAVAGALAWGCRYYSRSRALLYIFVAGAATAGVWLFFSVPWKEMGRIIPGLLALAAVLEATRLMRDRSAARIDAATAARVLLWFAAAALLARMALNPRVYHYGFYQAPLAATVGIATLLSIVPDRFALAGAPRRCYEVLLAVLILAGGAAVAWQSAGRFSLQRQAVGTGPDRFYANDSDIEPTGALIEVARRYLAADRSAQTLLVLPEGLMLNYLTRLPSPLRDYLFQPVFFTPENRRAWLKKLSADPPDRVVLLTRDMTEFGVLRFGESPEHGQELIEFVGKNYQTVYRIGGDPLDVNDRGLIIGARIPARAAEPQAGGNTVGMERASR